MSATEPDVESFRKAAHSWLTENAEPLPAPRAGESWGIGSDDVSVFHAVSDGQEQALLDAAMEWQRSKFDAATALFNGPQTSAG